MDMRLGDFGDLPLHAALAAFRERHGLTAKYLAVRPEARIHYERHDMVHILFGLDTTMRQEALADGWTLFGTDISRDEIREFFDLPEEKDLIKEIGLMKIVFAYLRAVPDYFRIAWRSRRMAQKWRWSDNADYRTRLVADIRREFGIPDGSLA